MRSDLAEKISELIKPIVAALGYDLWGCKLIYLGKQKTLRVYLDASGGVNIEACGKVSNQLRLMPELEELLDNFNLEVSSPGLDRQLFTNEHFQRYIGSKIQIKLNTAQNGRRNIVGILSAVAEEKITVNIDDEVLDLSFSFIEQARLVPEIKF